MAPKTVPDAAVEKELADAVRRIWKSGEKAELTVNLVRQRVEQKLGLDEGYLKDGDWKSKSKRIITNTVVGLQLQHTSAGNLIDIYLR